MKKVALTVWNGRISPVFDVSQEILVLDIEGDAVTARRNETVTETEPFSRVKKLTDLTIETLICGAISRSLAWALSAHVIQVIPFVAGDIEEVIEAFLADKLPNQKMAMPGCRGVHGPFRGRRRGSHRGPHGGSRIH